MAVNGLINVQQQQGKRKGGRKRETIGKDDIYDDDNIDFTKFISISETLAIGQ